MSGIVNKAKEAVGLQLPTRKLGNKGPHVTALGFGCMGLSAFYGPPKPDSERFAVLDKAYELGERNWDSADIYMDNEDLLGNWFKANPGKRDHIFLASKFTMFRNEDGSRGMSNEPAYIKQAIKKSLSRLGVDHIDLYYAHRLTGDVPVEDVVSTMAELKAEGKIKHIGLSECSAASLRRACKVVHVDAVQVEYSPFCLDIERPEIGLLKACRELGVAVVAYSPIGRGLLSGTYKSHDDIPDGDFRKTLPRFSPENFPKNIELVHKIESIAEKKGVTPTQLCLAWLMAQGDDIIPIPGTTRVDRLEENVGSLKIKLSKEEEREIREASENAEIIGTRYTKDAMKHIFADTPPKQ